MKGLTFPNIGTYSSFIEGSNFIISRFIPMLSKSNFKLYNKSRVKNSAENI